MCVCVSFFFLYRKQYQTLGKVISWRNQEHMHADMLFFFFFSFCFHNVELAYKGRHITKSKPHVGCNHYIFHRERERGGGWVGGGWCWETFCCWRRHMSKSHFLWNECNSWNRLIVSIRSAVIRPHEITEAVFRHEHGTRGDEWEVPD